MFIRQRHFNIDVTVGSLVPTATGVGISKVRARIAYNNLAGTATLWVNTPLTITVPVASVALGSAVDKFLVHDVVGGAGKYEGGVKNACGYTILKCLAGNTTVSRLEPVVAASGLDRKSVV